MEKVYKVKKKEFMGEEGRFIEAKGHSWLVLQDFFGWQGRLSSNNQIESKDRKKLNEFLVNIDEESARESFPIDFGKKKNKGNASNGSIQTVDCIRVDVLPIVLTQFEPTARAGKERHDKWCELMKFINELLKQLEVHRFIVVDTDHQKRAMERLENMLPFLSQELKNPYQRVNADVAYILAHFKNCPKPIYKPQIKKNINKHTKSTLMSRQVILDTYLNALEMLGTYKEAKPKTIEIITNRYYKEDK